MLSSKGNVVVFGVSGTDGIRTILEVEPETLNRYRLAAFLRKVSRQTGSDQLFAYNVPLAYQNLAEDAVASRILVDAILVENNEKEISVRSYVNPNPSAEMGKINNRAYAVKQNYNVNVTLFSRANVSDTPIFYSQLSKAI